MIPSIVATKICNCVEDFISTTFRTSNGSFKHLVRKFLEDKQNFYRGPYITLGLPFRPGTSGRNFFPHIPLKFTPFLHQEQAFARLIPPVYRSTLIATGTGSGKTECFLIPVLEHCRQYSENPGIKAIFIYPMNALATDQSQRIAEFIYQVPSLRGKVRVGLYVGEQDENSTKIMTPYKVITDKKILLQTPPDILLTNYKMLDYLLIQPQSQQLWRNNQPDSLRYLVVDEFHTFDGAQGTDLACLLRRLKYRLKTPVNHLVCVGTSATLGNPTRDNSDVDNKNDILEYAQTIFQEPFDKEALIQENRISDAEFLADSLLNILPIPGPDHLPSLDPDEYDSLTAYIQAQAKFWLPESQFLHSLGDVANTTPSDGVDLDENWRIELGKELKSLPIIHNLIRVLAHKSYTYEEILDRIGRRLQLPIENAKFCHLLLDSIFALISVARTPAINNQSNNQLITQPLLRLRVQVWFRELKRMLGSVEKQPKLLYSDDLTAEEREKTKTLPIILCRNCGATGWAGLKYNQSSNRLIGNDLGGFYKAFFNYNPSVAFIFPREQDSSAGGKYSSSVSDSSLLCTKCLTINLPTAQRCHHCNSQELIQVTVPDIIKTSNRKGQNHSSSTHDCPFCQSTGSLFILGSQAASLTSTIISTLYTTPFNQDKKLLTFSDSVQDAAHRAGFYNTRTYRTTLRTAIFQVIGHLTKNSNSVTLEKLITEFPQFWQERIKGDDNYIATFLPSDLHWLEDWEKLVNNLNTEKVEYTSGGKKDVEAISGRKNLVDLIKKRLEWDIVSQFGYRATVGPTLESSGLCGVSFNQAYIDECTESIHEEISNQVEGLRHVSPSLVEEYILGILYHLRQKGGILQSAIRESSYIAENGNPFVWKKQVHMPKFSISSTLPSFLVSNHTLNKFELVWSNSSKETWCEDWTRRVFGRETLLMREPIKDILNTTLRILEKTKILEIFLKTGSVTNNGVRVWGIPPSVIEIFPQGQVFICNACGHTITTPKNQQRVKTCQKKGCSGEYEIDLENGLVYYRQLYQKGQVRRVVAHEHTGMLSRPDREELERRFIHSNSYCHPNLISATSTLEMGINIGDLSSVILCSIPPNSANFQQRIGRAGRKNGSAFLSAIANGRLHDLFFYSDPHLLINGGVDPAGCYLNAPAILQRQLTAFCLDSWVAQGITSKDFYPKLKEILTVIEKKDSTGFPYTWLLFIQQNHHRLFEDFLGLFSHNYTNNPNDINSNNYRNNQIDMEHIKKELYDFMELEFLASENNSHQPRFLSRLEVIQKERQRFQKLIPTIRNKIREIKDQPAILVEQEQEAIDKLEREKAGFQELISALNEKNIFNFLTDEGILPNYAFPEAGVTLRSIILRKNSNQKKSDGEKYHSVTYSYERPSQAALKELVPGNSFYAQNRKITIDQIDLKLSPPEEWRICRNCNYADPDFLTNNQKTCPRCGDTIWSDNGRIHKVLKLKQVLSTTTDKESRFGDDSEDRESSLFQQVLLVDFDPRFKENTFLVQDPDFPFGFEYISRTKFREINLGQTGTMGHSVEIGGDQFKTRGFAVCGECGKVINNKDKDHAITCKYRSKPETAPILEALYLYREFESESIRFLMPEDSFWSDKGLHSFIAALQLGLKRKFRGKVDHLQIKVVREPQPHTNLRKSFLYLYDTVPGGTGYLRQLSQKQGGGICQDLRDVFEKALLVVTNCSCKERDEDGCYQCLFAYRNSFYQDQTSRKTAESLLSKLLEHWEKLQPDPTGNLSALTITSQNSYIESELELKFIQCLSSYQNKDGKNITLNTQPVNGKTGYYLKVGEMAWNIEPQVYLSSKDGVKVPSRADFVFYPAHSRVSSKPLVIFTDGWEYHKDKIPLDFDQRLAIIQSGRYWCWSIIWNDLKNNHENSDCVNEFEQLNGLDSRFNHSRFQKQQGAMTQLYQHYDCSSLTSLENRNSFDWLIHYLAEPNFEQWQNWGLLRTALQCQPQTPVSPQLLELWQTTGQEIIKQGQIKAAIVKISDQLEITSLIDPTLHHQKDKNASLVVIELKHNQDHLPSPAEWQESLRLFNLYQFIPRFLISTSTSISLPPLIPKVESNPISTIQEANPWEEIRQLIIEEDLLPFIDLMIEQKWPLPEIGYELTDPGQRVVANAELAWTEYKIALTTTLEDTTKFEQHHWQPILIQDLATNLDRLSAMLKHS
ncbi:DEAD/DEAH box helicase [Raphidiopsis sp. BLCC-F218]